MTTMMDYIYEEQSLLLQTLAKKKTIYEEVFQKVNVNEIEEIVICGSGTSYHAGLATKKCLEDLCGIRVRCELPMNFVNNSDIYNEQTLFIGISQGGRSISTIEALRKAQKKAKAIVAISENPDADIFAHADFSILMECGAELSVAKTKGYVVSVLLLFIFGLELALEINSITKECYEENYQALSRTVENIDNIIAKTNAWLPTIEEQILKSKYLLVLGYGVNYATTLEGGLKLLETLRFPIVPYELEEFCHGIYNAVNKDTCIIYLASLEDEIKRIPAIIEALKETTDMQVVIHSADGDDNTYSTTNNLEVDFKNETYYNVLEYIIPLQIISATIPYKLGINPFMASDPLFHKKASSKNV